MYLLVSETTDQILDGKWKLFNLLAMIWFYYFINKTASVRHLE